MHFTMLDLAEVVYVRVREPSASIPTKKINI
jgi:hypothetical protein